jgi:hypothetical protein
MPFAIIAGATLGAGLLGAGASKSAADTQAAAADRATQSQKQMFDIINAQNAPWRQAGQTALSAMTSGFGGKGSIYASQSPAEVQAEIASLQQQKAAGTDAAGTYNPAFDQEISKAQAALSGTSDQFTHQFNAQDLATNLSPSYNFMLQQGLGATQNALNVGGGNISGNTMRGMTKFAEDYASTGYQQAFENYTANQTNIFNRLSNIAGLGQTSNQTVAGAGAPISASTAQSMMSAGASRAAGTVGMANALGGAGTSAASWYSMPSMINAWKTPSTSSGAGFEGAV